MNEGKRYEEVALVASVIEVVYRNLRENLVSETVKKNAILKAISEVCKIDYRRTYRCPLKSYRN